MSTPGDLTPDQLIAYNAIMEGKNIFLTGPAGTGKSYLLHVLQDELQNSTAKKKRLALTAMTGCAALLLSSSGLKARTLHSWAGVGLAKETVPELVKKLRKNYHSLKRWLCTDLLVIDEISMMTVELLEKLDAIGKQLRKSDRPFGGIQLLFVGDFYQLPPVIRDGEMKFAFEASIWSDIIEETVHLSTITRQKEPEFQRLLMEARVGKLSPESIEILRSRMIPWDKEEIRPTLLFSRRAEVDLINAKNLKALKGERRIYKADFTFGAKATLSEKSPELLEAAKRCDQDAQYTTELELTVGAQVMLITNLNPDQGLVNGSRGVVMSFSDAGLPRVKFRNGFVIEIEFHSWSLGDLEDCYRSQIPLRLAYAITCHKAQGATLDCALVDIGASTFEFGQAYVALSRVKSLGSLYVHSFDHRVVKAHPKVIKFYGA